MVGTISWAAGDMPISNAPSRLNTSPRGSMARMVVYPLAVLLIAGGMMWLSNRNPAGRRSAEDRLRLIDWVGGFKKAMDAGPSSDHWFWLGQSVPRSVLDRLEPIRNEAFAGGARSNVIADVLPTDVLRDAASPATHSMFVKMDGQLRIVLRLRCDEDGVVCLGYVDPEYFN
ncbi:MAG: hypothetical protein KC983_03940 [Phycisphaerales bacterium]|nr:hypothetical protein [Phycisphaerales bacterium]